MDIPQDENILKILCCSQCQSLLSHAPIYQEHTGASVCSRCVSSARPATRNFVYEAAAKFLMFPCTNHELGCRETFTFNENTTDFHQHICPYQEYTCPLGQTGQCGWTGSREGLLTHCIKQHPANVIRNASELTPDITKSSLNTYILYVFRFLFLVHIKVSVSTGKIFYSIRGLCNSNNISRFWFSVDIEKGKNQFIRKSKCVEPQGCLSLQEESSLLIDINSMIGILDGFKNTVFTLTIWDSHGCNKCKTDLCQYFYPHENGWLCERCAPVKLVCEYKDKGCLYSDIEGKCEKHKFIFCRFSEKCLYCFCNIKQNTLLEHYILSHNDITYETGAMFTHTTQDQIIRSIISTEMGLLRCRIEFINNNFLFRISSQIPSDILYQYSCKVQVTDYDSQQTKIYELQHVYDCQYDWYIEIPLQDFPNCSGTFNSCVIFNRYSPYW